MPPSLAATYIVICSLNNVLFSFVCGTLSQVFHHFQFFIPIFYKLFALSLPNIFLHFRIPSYSIYLRSSYKHCKCRYPASSINLFLLDDTPTNTKSVSPLTILPHSLHQMNPDPAPHYIWGTSLINEETRPRTVEPLCFR